MNTPQFLRLLVVLLALAPLPVLAEGGAKDIEAATPNGDKVVLHANGRWEYVDAQKAQAAQEIAHQFPENQACPPGYQGGYLGLGRCIPPGDKDFNRGSRSGK